MPPRIGMCFDRQLPPPFLVEVAEGLEAAGADQVWIIEDCFYTAGISLAATALACTERLEVGLGILPAVVRNPAITAMEIATLAELAPGRLLAGIGHGVQEWMGQIGARPPSPLTALEETISVVGRLLRGERVDLDGDHVTMREVALERPPAMVPPLLAGVRGPNSLALAGRITDGLVLAEAAGPTAVRRAIEQAGASGPFRIAVFSALAIDEDAATARRAMAPFVAGVMGSPNPQLDAHPHIDEMRERLDGRGLAGLADMPREWWLELGAIGTFDDAMEHIAMLHEAGADDVSLFPGPEIDLVRDDLDHVARIVAANR